MFTINPSKTALLCASVLAVLALPAHAQNECLLYDQYSQAGYSSGGSYAGGAQSFACGTFSRALGQTAVAVGSFATANSSESVSLGVYTGAWASLATAAGVASNAVGEGSTAVGVFALARNNGGLAVGAWYDRDGDGRVTRDITLGDLDNNGFPEDGSTETAYAAGINSVAIGAGVVARGDNGIAFGFDSSANAADSVAMGSRNVAASVAGAAVGVSNTALGEGDVAFGSGNTAGMVDFLSLSGNNVALGMGNSATGGFATFFGNPASSSAAVGVGNQATGGNSSAVGVENLASGINSTAIGYSSVASADDSTAIGSYSVADRANTLSVGTVGVERQIVNVDAATQDTDAVNLSQLHPLADALGSGAGYIGGAFAAPAYVIQSNNYDNVGSAFGAVDDALTDINQRIVDAGGVQGQRGYSAYEIAVSNGFAGSENDWLQSLGGAQGPTGPAGPEGPAGGGPRSVTYDSDTRDVLTMAGADGTRIANVANAVEATDAVNLGQMEAGDAGTLAAANNYTDNTATETLTAANNYTDQRFAEITGLSDSFETFRNETDRRFQQQDRRIDKLSAMSGAYAGMAMNTAGLAGRNRVGVGVGAQGGEQALAVGYQRVIGNRASVSIAGAFSGDEKSVSAGTGFSW